jgi:hypothetical protein
MRDELSNVKSSLVKVNSNKIICKSCSLPCFEMANYRQSPFAFDFVDLALYKVNRHWLIKLNWRIRY